MGGSSSRQRKASGKASSSREKTSSTSDSEGHFETPESATPVHTGPKVPGDQETPALHRPDDRGAEEERLVIDSSDGAPSVSLSRTMAQSDPPPAPQESSVDRGDGPETNDPATDARESPPPPSADLAQAPSATPGMAADLPEEGSLARVDPETLCNGSPPRETAPAPKTKPAKVKPPSLKITAPPPVVEPAAEVAPQEAEDQGIPVPKVSYNFDPDGFDDAFNPFTSGGSKIQNSPPPCAAGSLPELAPLRSSPPPPPPRDDPSVLGPEAEVKELAPVEPKPVIMEFGLDDDGGVSKPPPRRLGKKPHSKLPGKKQRPKGTATASKSTPEGQPETVSPPTSAQATETSSGIVLESTVPQSLDDVPIQKSNYNFDPSQWDDPDFNPFGGSAKVNSSPMLPKGSYSFDPDAFDDSVDPFKPSKALGNEVSSKASPPPERPPEAVEGKKVERPLVEKKARQSPKKSKDRITNSCKVKKYESQSLVLDVCHQEEGAVASHIPEITRRVRHATDEEKLASTGAIAHRAETDEEEKHILECSRGSALIQPDEELQTKITDCLEEKDTCCLNEELSITQVSEGKEAQDTGSPILDCMSPGEMDKAAELTLIREEIICKEIEANEWKRKYEDSRMEVFEMRKIVAEYEKTVAQMIEDEQHKNIMGSSKSVHQLTLERDQLTLDRDQALADLNSVERSLSDLFRRYENMKAVLEGFKKNEEVLKKCAQEYLVRVRQEEQRYHTLKIHAEEKLDKANEDIAQVRSKATAEGVALNASLRMEQMKVDSMERALHQKNQEIEELTKICDELIAKLGTSD